MTRPRPQSPVRNPPSDPASYAVSDQASRGRVHPESSPADLGPFELDRHRILHCAAFRRLMHKTQVFVTSEAGDHFRTRLTHTLEVAAQAERLARLLGLNRPLVGAIALAHDLGHPPFGHAGEAALASLMDGHGGFEHNVQSLRVVDYLEHPYAAFRGLNLTFELRESIIKHRTLYDRPDRAPHLDEQTRRLLDAGPMPPLEGQAVNLADTIAYTLHDIEDSLVECGLTEDALNGCAVWRQSAAPVRARYPSHPLLAVRRPILDDIAGRLVEDAVAESLRRLHAAKIGEPDDARQNTSPLVAFSEETQAGIADLQALLVRSVYRNDRVVGMDARARRLVGELFQAYLDAPKRLPQRFRTRLPDQGSHRVICDYLAGMTDRFCQREHAQLCVSSDSG